MHKLLSAFFLLLAACATQPRVSEPAERDAAIVAINSAKTALLLIDMPPARRELAISQLDRFRAKVDESATRPISWTEWYSDLTTFALEWGIPAPKR